MLEYGILERDAGSVYWLPDNSQLEKARKDLSDKTSISRLLNQVFLTRKMEIDAIESNTLAT